MAVISYQDIKIIKPGRLKTKKSGRKVKIIATTLRYKDDINIDFIDTWLKWVTENCEEIKNDAS